MLLLMLSAPSCSTSQALTLRRLSHAVTEACGSIALDRDGWLEPEAVAAAAAWAIGELRSEGGSQQPETSLPPLRPQGEFRFAPASTAATMRLATEERYSAVADAAHGGDGTAQHTLGLLHYSGVGGAQRDERESAYWHAAAAVAGNVEARLPLALCRSPVCPRATSPATSRRRSPRWAAACGEASEPSSTRRPASTSSLHVRQLARPSDWSSWASATRTAPLVVDCSQTAQPAQPAETLVSLPTAPPVGSTLLLLPSQAICPASPLMRSEQPPSSSPQPRCGSEASHRARASRRARRLLRRAADRPSPSSSTALLRLASAAVALPCGEPGW